MTKVLLSIHVVAAIVAIGPVTVAASMFPGFVRRGSVDALPVLHRICRVYAALGVVVPVFGFATASSLGVLTDAWLLVSIGLTAVAAVVLVVFVLPGQAGILATVTGKEPAPDPHPAPAKQGTRAGTPAGTGTGVTITHERSARRASGMSVSRLGMVTGIFNLLWVIVVVLMIVRPGSTTGV